MNELFVSIKVDREERPDVDAVYMDAVVALSGQGGWPMTVFLTPRGRAVLRRHVLPARAAARHAGVPAGARRARRGVPRRSATTSRSRRQRSSTRCGAARSRSPSREPLTERAAHRGRRALRAQYDPQWGGFGRAPKFPPASTIEFLLRRGAFDLALGTLDGMRAGGMYDLVGGGFHRYSVDGQWLVPHFEKMLYDNALLVPAYLHALAAHGQEAAIAGSPSRRSTTCLRELRLDGGGFASAQDADTDGVEGLTFTWEPHEVPRARAAAAVRARPLHHPRPAHGRGARARCSRCASSVPQPLRDDKAIAAWNGLMLAALAEAGRRLDRADYLDAARELAEFLLGPLSDGERLHRTWRDGVAKGTGYLEDYANVAHGLYELHVATGDLRWLHESRRLALLAVELFADDANGGFFLTPVDGEAARRAAEGPRRQPDAVGQLDARVRAAPARTALGRRRARATRRRRAAAHPRRDPARAAGVRLGALRARPPPLAAAGGRDRRRPARARSPAPRSRGFDPNAVVAFGPATACRCSRARTLVDGEPAVYVCERFACRAPVTDPAASCR